MCYWSVGVFLVSKFVILSLGFEIWGLRVGWMRMLF